MTALATLLADSKQAIAFVARFDERDPGTDTVTTVNLQTANRAGTEGYPSLLSDPGGRVDKLEADEMEAIAAQTVAPVTLRNEPTAPGVDGPLDYLRNRSLAGRDITILAGSPTEAIANYEPVVTGVMDGEPRFDGSVVELRVKSPLERLNVDLDVGTYVGEPGALKILTSTGNAVVADNAAHHLAEFTLAGRFNLPVGSGATAPRLSVRQTSATARNWLVNFGAFTGGNAGKIVVTYSTGGVANGLSLTSPDRYDDGTDRWWVFARRTGHAYLMVDGEVVAESTSPAVPDTVITAGVQMGLGFQVGPGWLLDSRIFNHYIAPDEMRSAMAVRADGGEEGLVGLWRGDDNTGSTLTDYSATAAHATISGTEGIDFEHVSSDLGMAELAGRSMPALIGYVWHAPADLVNDIFERWRVNDRTLPAATHPSMRDEGELLPNADHDWDASTWSEAAFGLTSEAGEPLTVGHGVSNSQHVDEVLAEVLVERGPLASAELSLHRLHALHLNDMGIATRRRSVREILSEALGGALGFARAETDGVISLDALLPPISPSPRDGACLEIAGDVDTPASIAWSGMSAALTTANYTVACWMKLQGVGSSQDSQFSTFLMETRQSELNPTNGFSLEVGTTNGVPRLRLRKELSTTFVEVGFGDVLGASPDWFFVAAVHDATGAATRFYAARQGDALALIGTAAALHATAPPTQFVYVGPETVTASRGNIYGSVFEPQLWDDTLTLVELQALMDAAPAGTETDLAFYAPLDGDSAASLTDTVSTVVGVTVGDVREVPDLVLDLRTDPRVYRSRQQRPAHTIEVEYRRNFAVLDPSNIAVAVPQDEALDLQTPNRFERWSDPEIAADYLDAREISIPSLWSFQDGALTTLRRARYRFAPERELADLVDAGRRAILLGLGDEVRVYGSRWDLDTGPVFRVAANNVRLGELSCDLGLWR